MNSTCYYRCSTHQDQYHLRIITNLIKYHKDPLFFVRKLNRNCVPFFNFKSNRKLPKDTLFCVRNMKNKIVFHFSISKVKQNDFISRI